MNVSKKNFDAFTLNETPNPAVRRQGTFTMGWPSSVNNGLPMQRPVKEKKP